MKKTIAILAALVMVIGLAAAAVAEEAPTFSKGIQFNMDMDQVIQLMDEPRYEIDNERTRGPVEFYELEYENIRSQEGFFFDLKYLFVGNSLVALRYDFAEGTSYEEVKASLTAVYGEAVPFDASVIGNGKYAIDDDGELWNCKEMIVTKSLIIVLEQDHDGDVEATGIDPTAAFLFN